MSAAPLLAVLVALFLLGGRWSFARVLDVDDLIVYEVRFWVVIALALVAVLSGPRVRGSSSALPFLAFVGWFLVSTLWAPSYAYALDKGIELAVLAVGTLAILKISRSLPPHALLGSVWPILAVVLSVLALFGLVAGVGGGQRIAVLGGGPNVFGRNMGLLALVCIAAALGGSRRTLPIVAAIVAGALVLLSGSRGALVATAVGLVALFFVRRIQATRTLVVLALLVVAAAIAALYTEVGREAMAVFEQRILVLTLEQDHDAGRQGLYRDAIAMGMRDPIHGAGLGAFAAEGYGVYPHNLFLEAFAEGGIVGVTLLVIVLARAVWGTVMREIPALDAGAFMLLLTAAQFSGDFYDSRGVFVLALVVGIGHGHGRGHGGERPSRVTS